MSSSISLLQLPRLCIWVSGAADGRVLSGVGPHLEQYLRQTSGEYRLLSRTSVFGACGRPITSIKRIADSESFLVVGSSLMCILKDSELSDSAVPSSRIHSFTDEIVNIAFAARKNVPVSLRMVHHFEFGLVLRSGRTLLTAASIDGTNRLRVDTIAEYDGAKCGLLMSALCLVPAKSISQWKEMQCVAGSAMGEVRLWSTDRGSASNSTRECGSIGFVISMAVVDQCEERGEATVVAVTENRAINLWRIRYKEANWLQLLHKEEAAHAVRPSAVVYCSKTGKAVSSAEDGELCVWSISDAGISLLQRFQMRIGAIRSLTVDGEGRVLYGSVTGSLFSLPVDSLIGQPERRFIEGSKLQEHFRECDRTPIRSFAVVHHHDKYDESIAPGTRQTELQCLGEDGSNMEVTDNCVAEWVAYEGTYLHLNSWTDTDCAITVFHCEKRLRMNSYHPPTHLSSDSTGYTVLIESAHQSTILTARPTMSRGDNGAEPYAVVQSTGGIIALIRHCVDDVRMWRFRIETEETEGNESKKKRRNQMPIVNSVAIDRSSCTGLHVILGTTNGRILYAPMIHGEEAPEGVSLLDFALDEKQPAEVLNLHPRSRRLEKTSITQLEYCGMRRECVALSKNGWLLRMRVDGDKGLVVSEEDISRELGVEWPVRIERRGNEEYVIGFNARNLLVVSRRLKTCLLSIDCGGGHRQVHVDLEGTKYGDIEKITVHYGKHQGIVRHTQQSLTAGLQQLAWTPHRDKIVYCKSVGRYLLTGSIDGEIVLGSRWDYGSLSVRQRWYVPETTVACFSERSKHTGQLRPPAVPRLVIGGPKGELYVVDSRFSDWNNQESSPPLTAISTGNDSRVIEVCALDDYVVAAFADAQIAIFHLDSNLRAKRVAIWEMPTVHRSTFTKVCARFSRSGDLLIDAITSAGTLNRLSFGVAEGNKISHLFDVSIDRAALTVIRHDHTAGITVIGSDSGALFVYKDTDESLELLSVWRDAHACQITDLALFHCSLEGALYRLEGTLRIASIGMDCTMTVLERRDGGTDEELSLVRRDVFAVNDPSSIAVISTYSRKAIIAGCGLQFIDL